MKLCKVSDLFTIVKGNDFELNALVKVPSGINFVARGMKNNGVTACVKKVLGTRPFDAGYITVAASGSVMESFLQPKPFYTAYHVFILIPKVAMSDAEKLYYCLCLRKNKFKYSYGRQADTTLPDLPIPAYDEIPHYVKGFTVKEFERTLIQKVQIPGITDTAVHCSDRIDEELVPLSELFELHNGLSSDKVWRSKKKESRNWVPFIRPSYRQATSIDAFVNKTLVPASKVFPQGSLYVSTNGQGSHTYSYVSATEFVPNSDVCVLKPKRPMCLREKLFYAMCITRNRYKFSYGRKPKGDKLGKIMLPKYMPKMFMDCKVSDIFSSPARRT